MHVGVWGLAAIVVVIVSWLMYRYLAPKSWKEWTRAGVLQAFIIAFYAEMYGFSLTIYFLARDFGLDLAWTEGGNLWAQLFGTPIAHVVAMVLGYTIVFAGATLVADGWRRIHQARRQGRLMTDGVYGGTSQQVTSAVGADHAVREIPGSPAENPTPGAAGVPNSRKIRCISWNRLSGTVPA